MRGAEPEEHASGGESASGEAEARRKGGCSSDVIVPVALQRAGQPMQPSRDGAGAALIGQGREAPRNNQNVICTEAALRPALPWNTAAIDRKSTRLNSSH